MKIQCSCGAKYAFDISPEMGQTPIRFICQSCGLDSSEFVNELIRRELASVEAVAATPSLDTSMAPVEQASAGTSRIRIRSSISARPEPQEPSPLHYCPKHPGQVPVDHCLVCGKPICPKCMELFGYVCSPLCIGKAETQGIEIPVYRGKKSVIQSRHWRKVGLVAGAIAVVVSGWLGFWFWYAWFGSVPKPVFSVRFPEPAYAGQSAVCATNQIVFLHGDTLARHDIKEKKEIWSRSLIDPKEIDQLVAQRIKNLQAAASESSSGYGFKMPTRQEVIEDTKRFADSSLELHVRTQNIWVVAPVTLLSNDWKLVRYDWDTGKPLQEVFLGSRLAGWTSRGDELLLTVHGNRGGQAVTHINLVSGEWHVDKFILPSAHEAGPASGKRPGGKSVFTTARGQVRLGLSAVGPGNDAGKPLDPAKVAEEVQHMPLPARIALPATLSSELHQERILKELDDESGGPPRRPHEADKEPEDPFTLIPCHDGYVQVGIELLEERVSTRKAMKEPPAKSVMEGNFTVSQTAEAANEILNERQRANGGDTVTEDESRYQVTVRRPEVKEVPDWVGEVIGPPSFIPLKTVNVVPGGKMVVVLDKTNKKLWQATLAYKVAGGPAFTTEQAGPFGDGPCVEHGDALYVFDEAVLTAFDLATGTVRWRLPSIGTVGLLFDDEGMMYLNTTTASPERLKYSRQIDVSETTSSVILKIDPRTGKTLWAASPGGFITYISGKFIYTLSSHRAPEKEDSRFHTGLEIPSYVLIQRLDPRNGHVLWPHREPRAPLDVQFNRNSIQLVFKKEVEVLTYISF